MSLHRIILGYLFGLAFMMSQIAPVAAMIGADCLQETAACACCDGLDSCPCANEGEPSQNPLPMAPESGQTVKAPMASATGTQVWVETVPCAPGHSSIATTAVEGPWNGYVGVPLSIAFCSFVI